MVDLAAYLQDEVDKERSARKVANRIGISHSALVKIVKRNIKTMPDLKTLELIASAYGLTLPAVIEMAGAILGDGDRYARLARELERLPWIAERFDDLMSLSEDEFTYFLDFVVWKRRQAPPDSIHPQPNQ